LLYTDMLEVCPWYKQSGINFVEAKNYFIWKG